MERLNQIILPLGAPPIITYTNYAYPISSFCYDDKYNNWFYSNYVNLTMIEAYDDIKLNFLSGDSFGGVKPLQYKQNTNVTDIIKEIYDKVSDGWYIYTYVNYKYINCNYDFYHNILIHGIDLEEKLIYVAGYNYNKFNQYQQFTISIEDFALAYYDENNKNKNRVIFWKPRGEKEKFLYDDFKLQLTDYLNSKFTISEIGRYYYNIDKMTTALGKLMDRLIIDGHTKNDYLYGINCAEALKHSIIRYDDRCRFDLRLFRSFLEHKQVMKSRFQHFKDENIYPFDMNPFIEISADIEKNARIVFNSLIKCKMTNKVPDDISPYIDNIISKEKLYYTKFLDLI